MNRHDDGRNEAASHFVQLITMEGYEIAKSETVKLLENGPEGISPDPKLVALHNWYAQLSTVDQKFVRDAVRVTAHLSVFGILVMLDGASGLARLEGKPFDFAVEWQLYPDDDAFWDNRPERVVRVNPLEKSGEELHDLFLAAVESER